MFFFHSIVSVPLFTLSNPEFLCVATKPANNFYIIIICVLLVLKCMGLSQP